MDAKSFVITYDTLFDLLKREKERTDLQKLEPTFYNDVVIYLRNKTNDQNIFSSRQIENLTKILKEMYERREKKIISMAFDKSRTQSNLVDTSNLLHEERVIFESIVGLLDHFRKNILGSILSEKEPLLNMHLLSQKREEKSQSDFKTALELHNDTKLVRFLHAVPKFVGTELEEYGPFQEEDVAKLPAELADVLISKGRVEEIKESQ